ncbi:uncharacterized protein LOC144716891 [Wolffia australiana]
MSEELYSTGQTRQPAVPGDGFTDADFQREPLSHKVTHSLPAVPDTTCLQGPNLLQWRHFVETTLKARQLFKHCTQAPLPSTHPHYAAWEAEEHFVLGWLYTTSLAPSFRERFPRCATVKGFWDQANKFCGREGDNWRLFMLVAKASNFRQGALSISDYALEHKKLWDEVDYYLPTDDPTCKSFQNTLRLRLLGFLYGLNKEYDDTRRHALHRKEGLPSIDDLVKELQEEESHFHVIGTLSSEAARDSTALLARPPSPAPAPPAEAAPSGLICSYCSKPGHLRKWCKKRQYDNRKKEAIEGKAMFASSSTSSTSPATLEQLQADLARLRDQVATMQTPTQSTAHFGGFGGSDYTD